MALNYSPAKAGPGYGYYGPLDVVPNYSKSTGGTGYASGQSTVGIPASGMTSQYQSNPSNYNPVQSASGSGSSELDMLRSIGSQRNPYQESQYQALMKQLQDSAQSAQSATLRAIENRLNETRNLAKQKISNAEENRNYITNFISERYPQLVERAQQAGTNLIEDLTGQETTLGQLYERAKAQARRRSESAALTNRNIARAGNRLGSSFYDETVAQNQEDLGRQLGETDLERISKLAAIGTQKTRVNQDTENTIQDIESQRTQAEYAAYDEYKRAVQEAEALERAGVLDFGEGEAQAAANLQNRLDSIAQWSQGIAEQRMALEAQYGSGGGFDTRLSTIGSNTSNFINSNAATPQGNSLLSYAPTTLSAAGSNPTTNYQGFTGARNELTLDDILKGVRSGGLTFS